MKVKITEAEFTAQVIQLARLRGWKVLHIRAARTASGWRTPIQGDGTGWPDLFMVRGDQKLAAELKVGKNKATAAQVAWLDALAMAGVPCYTWTPADWKTIEAILEGTA